jgi:peptidoglycan hydrolase-like protein with peptidoglycan-binding domain
MTDVKGGYQRPTTTAFISSSYGDHRYNRKPPSQEPGTDYGAAFGSALFAPEDGTVVEVKTSTSGATGRFIAIDFTDGQRGRALHLSHVGVSVGQKVKRGQQVGRTGASAWGKEWGVGAHVHQSLFPTHSYGGFGPASTIDFEARVGADNDDVAAAVSQLVASEQMFLKVAQGETGLVVDGILGPNTRAAIKRYQTYLTGRGWYSGKIDGDWGDGTQKGHEKRYAEWVAQTQAPASPQYHTVTLDDIATIGNVEGLQKIARLYLKQDVDNRWGPKSKQGLQRFLDQNYGGSLVGWLRARWGYVGNDQFGPVMKAALQRANAENLKAL